MKHTTLSLCGALVIFFTYFSDVHALTLSVAGEVAGLSVHSVAAPRLWLGLHHRAAAGLALNTHAARHVVVEAHGLPHAGFAPCVRRRWMGLGQGGMYGHARWLHAVRALADGGQSVEVDLEPDEGADVLWVDLTGYRDWSKPARLEADPRDTAPLGDRRPLILVHGLLWASPDGTWSPLMVDAFTDTLMKRRELRTLSRTYKVYAFSWPSFAGSAQAGRVLVDEVRALYGGTLPERRVVLVGHSSGGLVVRHALNTDRFGDAVRHAFTLATAHHGTLIASVSHADHRLADIFGNGMVRLLREALGVLVPECPGLAELAWDGHGDALAKPELAEIGVRQNPGWAAFNAADAYLDRLTVLAADCTALPEPLDALRRLEGRFGATFANCDPLVPKASAAFEGADVDRIMAPDVSHVDWAMKPGVLEQLMVRLAEL